MTYIPPMQVLTKHEREELREQNALWYGIRAIRAVVTIDALELALREEHAKTDTHVPGDCHICDLLEAVGETS